MSEGEQLHAAYDETAATIRRNNELREMAAEIGLEPEDAATEALARLVRSRQERPEHAIENLAAWMVGEATNFIVSESRTRGGVGRTR